MMGSSSRRLALGRGREWLSVLQCRKSKRTPMRLCSYVWGQVSHEGTRLGNQEYERAIDGSTAALLVFNNRSCYFRGEDLGRIDGGSTVSLSSVCPTMSKRSLEFTRYQEPVTGTRVADTGDRERERVNEGFPDSSRHSGWPFLRGRG